MTHVLAYINAVQSSAVKVDLGNSVQFPTCYTRYFSYSDSPGRPRGTTCPFSPTIKFLGRVGNSSFHLMLRIRMNGTLPLLLPYAFMVLTRKTLPFYLLWVKVLHNEKIPPQVYRQESHWCSIMCIQSAKNSVGCCLNCCILFFGTLSSNLKIWPLSLCQCALQVKLIAVPSTLSHQHHK